MTGLAILVLHSQKTKYDIYRYTQNSEREGLEAHCKVFHFF